MAAPTEQRRVLFVEDEPSLCLSYGRFFADRYVMSFASSGAEALDALDRFVPDIVVLDLRLPDTDGVELMQRIRARLPDLPVVITSAYLSMEPLMSVLNLGHSGYLVKPFELTALRQLIDAAG
jgi:DNA-binding response OmpR family regulator